MVGPKESGPGGSRGAKVCDEVWENEKGGIYFVILALSSQSVTVTVEAVETPQTRGT